MVCVWRNAKAGCEGSREQVPVVTRLLGARRVKDVDKRDSMLAQNQDHFNNANVLIERKV